MTLDERIEAAASAMRLTAVRQESWDWHARETLRAAFPELFTSPPTHKIVPIEPTEQMVRAGHEPHIFSKEISVTEIRAIYRAMLDASP